MYGDLGLQLIGQHTEHAFFVQVLFVLPLIIEPFDNAIFQCLRDASVAFEIGPDQDRKFEVR